ncbi:hypothetical protein ASAP_2456 [Asaia bogorensis]|uniref:Uncharacterized protein n=1 Tax=Asaia bogorensis TaxID=91915 RepID=A0A060QL65_9PROT|nr:hypothetical protein ASAP_2456 [Asaia bogorensis]
MPGPERRRSRSRIVIPPDHLLDSCLKFITDEGNLTDIHGS